MREFLNSSAYFGLLLSLAAYMLGIAIRKNTGKALFNPLLTGALVTALVLLALNVDYAAYERSASGLSALLTPATAALAVPMYRKIGLLKKNAGAVLAGTAAGVLASFACTLAVSVLFGLDHERFVTLLPKSVTTAIGMELAYGAGGDRAIASAVIVVTGIVGNMSALAVTRIARIKDPAAVGIAVGSSSHAIGTAKALETGETQGAFSSISLAVSAIVTSVLFPLFSKII